MLNVVFFNLFDVYSIIEDPKSILAYFIGDVHWRMEYCLVKTGFKAVYNAGSTVHRVTDIRYTPLVCIGRHIHRTRKHYKMWMLTVSYRLVIILILFLENFQSLHYI